MKRISAILLAIVAISFASSAQNHYSSRFYIGAKAGTTMSKMDFAPTVKQSMVNGFMGGVSFRYSEEKHFGVIAELNIEQRGWKEDFEGAPLSYQRKLTYLQLPLMTHIFFGNKSFKGFFNLGPEFGYMIGENISADFDYTRPLEHPEFPDNRMTEQMSMEISNKFDYGIALGVGMEFIAKRRHSFMLEGRFYYGLGNIYPDSKSDTFSASRGISIQLSLGYMFRIK